MWWTRPSYSLIPEMTSQLQPNGTGLGLSLGRQPLMLVPAGVIKRPFIDAEKYSAQLVSTNTGLLFVDTKK